MKNFFAEIILEMA